MRGVVGFAHLLAVAGASTRMVPEQVRHAQRGYSSSTASSAFSTSSIFHFGEFTIRQAKARMAEAGIPVRMD
jgi:cyclase